MTLDDLKKLRADLGYVRDDPDGKLTNVQSYHLARAIRTVRDEIVRLEADDAVLTRMLPNLGASIATAKSNRSIGGA